MVAHAANTVGLNHGFDAGFVEGGDSEVGFGPITIPLNDDEFGVVHGDSIRLCAGQRVAARGVKRGPVRRLLAGEHPTSYNEMFVLMARFMCVR